jgi:hypothetical protein
VLDAGKLYCQHGKEYQYREPYDTQYQFWYYMTMPVKDRLNKSTFKPSEGIEKHDKKGF